MKAILKKKRLNRMYDESHYIICTLYVNNIVEGHNFILPNLFFWYKLLLLYYTIYIQTFRNITISIKVFYYNKKKYMSTRATTK